ncbi:MAG TPA: PadR family transcriptional regulator [Lacisediminihabitans sp.]|uniref:PadR family transcriptional regulator n=1 Tax=Lacisediminihabitans sp. TaxID=2787631 RepID=UPI002ED85C3C
MTPPVFAHGHLRLYLLSILASQPMHGYELIQALENRFGGTYVPSAGTIYPRLAKLEEEGLVSKTTEGRKTVYAITEAGRAELEAREGELDGIESDVTDSVRRLADEVRSSVGAAMKTLRADLAAAARDARSDARETDHKAGVEPERQLASMRLREAEMVVNEFRHQVRTDLRGLAARGRIPENTVELLKTRLAEVREALRANG